MRPEILSISPWVYLFHEANLADRDEKLSGKELEHRMRTWPLCYPCVTCQKNYAATVKKYSHLIKECAMNRTSIDWYRFVRREINPKAAEVRLTNIPWHSYVYLCAILFTYEPRVNSAYCRRVKRFLQEWNEQFANHTTWENFRDLWDVLDRIYPKQAKYRSFLYEFFQHAVR